MYPDVALHIMPSTGCTNVEHKELEAGRLIFDSIQVWKYVSLAKHDFNTVYGILQQSLSLIRYNVSDR